MIVWGLFDSGNGSYYKAAQKMGGIELYSVGLDIENKNDHNLSIDLDEIVAYTAKKYEGEEK